MVLFHFKSLHPLLKVERHYFGFLDECCTLHSECCTLWISILRTAITVVSFRITGAINSQNEALDEFYGLDGCKPSRQRIVSNSKKAIRTSIGSLMFFGLLFSITCFFTLKRDHRCWSSIYLPWRVVHHGSVPSQIPAPTSKSRTALFRLFGRMLHLAQQMFHHVDIDSSNGLNCCLV